MIASQNSDPTAQIKRSGLLGRRLWLINGHVADVPNALLRKLADHPSVESIHWDRPTGGTMNRAAVSAGARAARFMTGLDGTGVGVAVIDSGITPWHDDLTYGGSSPDVRVVGGQRVAGFVDFVNGYTTPYDDNGHGTHVAGIIAGNGYDTYGARAGIAPAAHLVALKVLDSHGRGIISDVIAAFDYVVANREAYNIRVVNVSVGAAVLESFNKDPLTLAARRAVDAGIVVVAAAGNLGKNNLGQTQYGGITAPGNAPWVLTVGASDHEGTLWRGDDTVADYSSRGPTAIDFAAKPDLVAPGTGIVSLSNANSTMYATKATHLLRGSRATAFYPYLSLTGTSMAAPVVTGTVALMLEANPALTPNLVKAILQYTAEAKAEYDALTQGAGFLNVHGAVTLSHFFDHAEVGSRYPISRTWSRQLIWGNQRITGGVLKPNGSAWQPGVVWGAAAGPDGFNIVWGTECEAGCFNIVWGTMDAEWNIVWGTASEEDNIVWGTFTDSAFNIVWGTALEEDNVVWGTDCGGDDCFNIVWGTSVAEFNIVWGTALPEFNIVWGTNGEMDNIVWGTSAEEDNVTWGTAGEETPLFDDPAAEPVVFDEVPVENLFEPPPIEQTVATTTATTTGGGL